MRLSELLAAVPQILDRPSPDPEITGIESDSRRVKPGNTFVAFPGGSADGHDFIAQAVAAGAAAVVGEREGIRAEVPYVRTANARRALGWMAAAWHGYPARRLILIGVTGTDGKTTTVNMIFSILRRAGIRAGMISTVGAVIGGSELDTGFHVTTPDAPAVQEYLGRMAAAGLTHAVLEVTSHGLAQDRLAGCVFDLAAITNITPEHLDYHATFENYRAAKALLFAGLEPDPAKPGGPARRAILNADDPSFEYLRSVCRVPVLSYGSGAGANVRWGDIRQAADHLGLRITSHGRETELRSPLLGAFVAEDIAAAWTVCVEGLGIDPAAAADGVTALEGIPGRMERIAAGQDFTAVVDFAHTPNALRRALSSARDMTAGRVIAVFGAAGLRDPGKRAQMAAVGVELADLTILTAEDPRTEPLEGILEEMAAGARAAGGVEGENFFRRPDRGDAIRFAVKRARPGDLVVACGKGHEQSMCFGAVEYPWDDRRAMRVALAERLGLTGPAMPELPTSRNIKEES